MKKRLLALLIIPVSCGLMGFGLVWNDNYFDIVKNIEIFTKVYKELNANYAEDVDPNSLMKIGLDAMVNSLDPYTVYYSESQIEKYRYLQEGKYNGIGGDLAIVDGHITITETVAKSPLSQSGLKAGDKILKVEDEDVVGIPISQFMGLLRTYGGETVRLTVSRVGESAPIVRALQKGEVEVNNVPYYKVIDGDIGYVILTTFTRNASGNIKKAINDMKKENPEVKGVILDLRYNGGGLLNEAVNICNLFIPEGKLVVSTKGKLKDKDQIFKTRGSALDPEIPLAVLINGRSASASEIVSGVIQDYDRGVLLGQQSFGKGLVQNTREIGYNSRLKVTISKYYIPSNRCIQGVAYDNGKPVDIPDSLRSQYTTENGRTVLDGGGVQPDIELVKKENNELVQALTDQHMFLKYANTYVATRDSIVDYEEWNYTEYEDFLKFLQSEGFSYTHSHEKMLRTMVEESVNDTQKIELKDALAAVEEYKKSLLNSSQETITDILEEELVSRYHFETGRVAVKLRNDDEVTAAVQVLKDKERYNQILAIK